MPLPVGPSRTLIGAVPPRKNVATPVASVRTMPVEVAEPEIVMPLCVTVAASLR